ncbi:hypothetical protein FQN55_000702 [Onygenales sp. PD_40]|nr:hypothetical protein FQN55_000702 [Onygenales sp. PD_40]
MLEPSLSEYKRYHSKLYLKKGFQCDRMSPEIASGSARGLDFARTARRELHDASESKDAPQLLHETSPSLPNFRKSMSARSHSITASLLQIRLWLGGKIFGPGGPRGTKATRRTPTKGPCEPTGLAAMNYVAKHTSIPIPNIIKTYKHHDALYIEMEYISATSLEKAWLGGHLSQAEKEDIVTELASYVSQLRGLNPPHREIVGSAHCNACLDYRVGFSTFGPFTNHQDFHSFLRRGLAIENCTESFSQDITASHSRVYQSRFTHAGLCPRNILVRDGKVCAIIDWEFAGWYPEYWEYTKAHYGQIKMPDWYAQLGSVMGGYGDELNAERVLWN